MNKRIKDDAATAYHEAGHAAAYILTNRKFKHVTIKPDEDSSGSLVPHLRSKGAMHFYNMSIEGLSSYCIRSLSGPIAEFIRTGRNNHVGAKSDYQHVGEVILSVFGEDGPTVQLFLKFIKSHTKDLLLANWDFVERIAHGLMEHEALSYQDVIKLRIM